MTPRDPMIAGRIQHVRDLCTKTIERDGADPDIVLTDRQWLAESILNILDGKIDAQIVREIKRGRDGHDRW